MVKRDMEVMWKERPEGDHWMQGGRRGEDCGASVAKRRRSDDGEERSDRCGGGGVRIITFQ